MNGAMKLPQYSEADHTFVLSAYGRSPYLEECLQSLLKQTARSNVLVATSTPSQFLDEICEKYKVPQFRSGQNPGICSDWNFAVSCSRTSLVTIAHQDDIYEESYVERMLAKMNEASHPLIFFSNYGELRDGEKVDANTLLRIKRFMLLPMKRPSLFSSKFVRRRMLSFGSAICCPSVTLAVPNLPMPLFYDNLKCNLDWQAWERVSRMEGEFLYDPSILMYHRIHEESETTALIKTNVRAEEDLYMLERFWPRPIARIMWRFYTMSLKSNG